MSPARPHREPPDARWVRPAQHLIFMLKWALIFFLIALVAGALGFTTIAGASIAIAKILFFIFLAIVVVLVLAAIFIGKKVL